MEQYTNKCFKDSFSQSFLDVDYGAKICNNTTYTSDNTSTGNETPIEYPSYTTIDYPNYTIPDYPNYTIPENQDYWSGTSTTYTVKSGKEVLNDILNDVVLHIIEHNQNTKTSPKISVKISSRSIIEIKCECGKTWTISPVILLDLAGFSGDNGLKICKKFIELNIERAREVCAEEFKTEKGEEEKSFEDPIGVLEI